MELSALAVISLLRSDISICNPELCGGWGGRAPEPELELELLPG